MIERLKTHDTYDGFTYPSPKEMMNKINEVIDYLNIMERSRMTTGNGGGDVRVTAKRSASVPCNGVETPYRDPWEGNQKGGAGGSSGGCRGAIQVRDSDGSVFFIKGGGLK